MKRNLNSVLIFTLFLIFSSSAFSAISISSMTGGSNTVLAAGQTNIYFSSIGSGYSYAASCDTTINPHCVSSSSNLNLTVASSIAVNAASTIQLYVSSTVIPTTGTTTLVAPGLIPIGPYTGTGASVPISVSFNALCTAGADPSGNCSTDTTGLPYYVAIIVLVNGGNTFTPGTDDIYTMNLFTKSSINQLNTGGLGIASFLAFPGDAAIHIKNVSVATPSTINTIGAQGARFYYQSTTTPGTTFNTMGATPTFQDVTFTDVGGDLSNNYIENLTNGTTYCVVATVVDNAGNIGLMSDPATRSVANNCVTPDQIAGLLSKNGECFIATAAFGSPLETQVQTLRNFRDKYLMRSQVGRNFVSWYYRHSPKWADGIRQSESKKKVVRTFLWPLVGYSKLALNWGATNATLFAITILLLPLLFIQMLIFQKRRRAHA